MRLVRHGECPPQSALQTARRFLGAVFVIWVHVGNNIMSRSQPPNPASKARMSRKQPAGARPGRMAKDPKDAFSSQQLAEVGAIVLIWNQIDVMVDWLVHISLKLPITMFWEVVRRIGGVSAKVELLRLAAERARLLNDETRKCIKYTLDGVIEYKTYRDNIAHSTPFDPDKGIVQTWKHGTDLVQTLVTIDALTGLYERLSLLLLELREIDLLYRLADEEGARAVYRREGFDPLERRRTRDVPIQTAQTLKGSESAAISAAASKISG